MPTRSHLPVMLLLCSAVGLLLLVRPSRSQDAQPGIEVQARGPVHEAFATLTADPVATRIIAKQPPAPIEEMPPEEKPEGDVVWISGYWAYDDDRDDFLWVSGLWRTVPPQRQWVAGYWRDNGNGYQWVPGFWTTASQTEEQQMTYLPEPPARPNVAPPPRPTNEDCFYVPGNYVWNGGGYVWRAGYWARVQPGWVWVADHYRWTPTGYLHVCGYWDLAVKRRGILYAPVVISPTVVRVGFTYTPRYAVRDTIIVDSLFVHPTTCHYYFGDYYEVKYRRYGYESCVVYSERNYDSIIVYERHYERRRDPTWFSLQVNLYNDRCAGRAPVPPRVVNQTVVNQTVVNNTTVVNNVNNVNVNNINNVNVNNVNNTNVNNLSMVAPASTVTQTKNIKTVKLDETTRGQAREQAQVVQSVAKQRSTSEVASPGGAPTQAKVASIAAPKVQPVKQGMVAPKPPPSLAKVAQLDKPVTALPKTETPVVKPLVNTPVANATQPVKTAPIVAPVVTKAPSPQGITSPAKTISQPGIGANTTGTGNPAPIAKGPPALPNNANPPKPNTLASPANNPAVGLQQKVTPVSTVSAPKTNPVTPAVNAKNNPGNTTWSPAVPLSQNKPMPPSTPPVGNGVGSLSQPPVQKPTPPPTPQQPPVKAKQTVQPKPKKDQDKDKR